DGGCLQLFPDGGEIRAAEFLPFGDDRQRVRALQRIVRAVDDFHVAVFLEQLSRLMARGRIISLHARALPREIVDQAEARGLAHVVGVGLEGEPPERNCLSRQGAEMPPDLAGEHVLLRLVDRLDGGEQFQGVPGLAGAALQRLHVLGKARAAEAGAGVQELVADARVPADAAPRFFNSSMMACFTLSAVPTGTVDLVTTTL